MESNKKQRIIGGLVLVAVVAIFLPVLFHNSHPSKTLQLSMDAPNPPAKPAVELALPKVVNRQAQAADSNNDEPIDVAETPDASKNEAEKTPAVTQKILNTPAADPSSSLLTQVQHAANDALQNEEKPLADNADANNETQSAVNAVSSPVPDSADAAAPPSVSAEDSTSDSAAIAPAASSSASLQDESAALPKEQTSPSAAPMKKTVTKAKLPSPSKKLASKSPAFVLQVGSFSNVANAESLVKQLRAKGFDVYSNQTWLGGKKIVRVYIGPDIRRDRLAHLQQQLQRQLHLRTVIRKYPL